MTIQVQGLKETLRDLQKLEPETRKQINKDIRRTVKPVADHINSNIPSSAPLSGMNHSGRTGWNRRKAVAIKLDARKPRRYIDKPTRTVTSVVRITTKDAPTAIVDMAGKAGGGSSRASVNRQRPNFDNALSSRLGPPSRFMWRDTEQLIELAQHGLIAIIRNVEDEVNRDLKVTYR